MPGSWSRELILLRTELLPSPAQQRAALGADHPVRVLGLRELITEVRRQDPDVIMLAATGPIVELLTALPVLARPRRVLVSGLPGLAVPVSAKAVRARRRCDVLIAHSRRERAELITRVREVDLGLEVALARLPFLPEVSVGGAAAESTTAATTTTTGPSVIFAAQALVPPDPGQRLQILDALSAVPPPLRPVVKLRAADGEQQTHHEDHPYPQLWRQRADDQNAADQDAADQDAASITFSHEPMDTALRQAHGLVTVSSTAALEAMAAGVGVIVLEDFGVSPQMINTVFADSGCLGTLADLRAGRFKRPTAEWMRENYFHPEVEDDLAMIIEARRQQQRAGQSPRRPRVPRSRVSATVVRLMVPRPVRSGLRRLRDHLGRR